MAKLCTVDGCSNKLVAKGYCAKHYKQIQKHGHLIEGYSHKNTGPCSVKGCNKPSKTKGYCSKHYQQTLNFGEIQKNTIKDLNEVVDKGRYYELILTNQKGKEVGRAKVDREDLSLVQKFGRWTLGTRGYVVNNEYEGTIRIKTHRMHRVIMKAKKDKIVDHRKEGEKSKSDNRKKNLRLCTVAENQYNVKKRVDNVSGYKGVSAVGEVYQAQIMIKGKSIKLGYYRTAKRASRAYEKAAKGLHKDFYYKPK